MRTEGGRCQCLVERPRLTSLALVDRLQRGVGSIVLRRRGVVDSRKGRVVAVLDAQRNGAGNPGAERRRLVILEADDGTLEEVALNLVEQVGSRQASGDRHRSDVAAELFDEFEAFPHFGGNTFEDGARHFAA